MQTQTVGSKLLKVVGILLIVFGSIGLVGAIVTIGGIALLISLGYNGTLLYVAAAISIISAIVNLSVFPNHLFHPDHVIPSIELVSAFSESACQCEAHGFMEPSTVLC